MKFLKLLRWAAYNVAEFALLYYFLFEDVGWCGNLYKFLLWIGFFVALLMIAVGFSVRMFSKKDTSKHLGEVIMGFGILFFGMKLMSEAMEPLRTYAPFIDLLNMRWRIPPMGGHEWYLFQSGTGISLFISNSII